MGWFSIGLGLVELLGARPLARGLGMRGDEGLLRLYGMREVVTGIGILAARDPALWMWGRVAGDAADIATLADRFEGNPRKGPLMAAVAFAAGATAIDVVTARALAQPAKRFAQPTRDYSSRSGYPRGIDAIRGAAARDFAAPRDMRAPEAMRAFKRS